MASSCEEIVSSCEEIVIAPADTPSEQYNQQRIAYRRVVRRESVVLKNTGEISRSWPRQPFRCNHHCG